MKVKELIEHLQTLDSDGEVFVTVRKGARPICDVTPIEKIETVFSIDNPPRESFYAIDVDVEQTYQVPGDE